MERSSARFSVSNVYACPLLSSRATVSSDVEAAVVWLIVVAAGVVVAAEEEEEEELVVVVDHSYTV